MKLNPKRVKMIENLATTRQGYLKGKTYIVGKDIEPHEANDLIAHGLALNETEGNSIDDTFDGEDSQVPSFDAQGNRAPLPVENTARKNMPAVSHNFDELVNKFADVTDPE